jgi:very-short-patch-repair endonuclease
MLASWVCGFAVRLSSVALSWTSSAPAVRLVIEVDGEYHSRRGTADARRDRVLRRLGYQVLRLEAELVLRHPEQASALIRGALSPPP